MISASQDLPYMTPPIANQHFSGDSQDSSSKIQKIIEVFLRLFALFCIHLCFSFLSEGYTSISVREPLANILAQQPPAQSTSRSTGHARDVNDSHYATVSDDSGMN